VTGFVRFRIRRACGYALGLLAVGLAMAALPAAAAAATPLALDVPNNGASPYVDFDTVTGVTFIAWTDPQTTTNGAIDLCVLPANASACSGGGPVALTVTHAENNLIGGSNTISLGGLTILPNGDVVVIATPVSTGSIAFESTGDGSAFLTSGQGLQNGGSFISPVSLFYTGDNVAPLGNTDVALLDDYNDHFSDSPFAGPEYPASLPSSNSNPGGLYPRKAQDTSGPEVAAEAAPPPAAAGTDIVIGVGDNYGGPNTQLSDCVNGDDVGTGYGVDVGKVGQSSAAGYLNHQTSGASMPAYTGLACNAENPVVASPEGGTQGIGVLENEGDGLDGGTNYSLDYRAFDVNSLATGGSFGGAALVAKLADPAGDIDVVDDSTDGVYAMWSGGGNLNANYSADGGAVWGPPVVIPEPSNVLYRDPVITAVGGGNFLLSYDDNTGSGYQTFVEAFSYQTLEQAPTTLATIQSSGTTKGADLSIPAGTVGESDTATISGTNASSATGTVDFALYDNSSCTGTPKFAGAATAAAGVASIADDSNSALAVGKYYWKVAYTGNTFNMPSASTCGSEVLTVGPAATIGSSGTTTGSTVTFTISCAAACTVTVTIEVPGGSAAGVASAGQKKKKARKPVKLGTAKLKLKKRGKGKLTVKLNGKGKSLFKKDHDKLKTTLLLSTKTAHGTFASTSQLKITKAKGKAKRK
jgi:hypothetical protein